MKKRRILYFINALPPGGAERQLIYTISGLDRERFEPIVLTLYNENEIPYHYRANLEALNVPIYCLNLARRANPGLRFLNGTLRYIWHVWRFRPHIVHG